MEKHREKEAKRKNMFFFFFFLLLWFVLGFAFFSGLQLFLFFDHLVVCGVCIFRMRTGDGLKDWI